MKNLSLMLTMLAAVLVFAGSVQAASVNTLIVKDGVTTTTADDASAEYISLGGTGINDYDNTRIISVGDVIRGGFAISRINSTSPNLGLGTSGGVDEWSGAFSIKVVSITEHDATGTNNGAVGEQDWTIVFGADPNFGAWLNSISADMGWANKGDNMVQGTAVRMWEDTTPDINLQAKTTDANAEKADKFVATAMDGQFYWDLGFGSRGSTWIAAQSALYAAPDTTGALAANPGNFELTMLQSSGIAATLLSGGMTGYLTGSPVAVDVIGNTSLLGAGVASAAKATEEGAGFHASDKATLEFIAVPVPQAVWLGLGLIGMIGLGARRRRRLS